MERTIRNLVSELSAGLKALYGDRLRGVFLYGSYARGEQDGESDVDILVVLDRLDSYGAEIDRTSHLVSEVSLKYGVSVSRVFVSERELLETESPFLANVRDEMVPV